MNMAFRAFRRSAIGVGTVIAIGWLFLPTATRAATALNSPTVKTEINIDRQQLGLNVLRTSFSLDKVARQRVADMARYSYFSHISPSGQSFATMLNRQPVRWRRAGETLGLNFRTAQETVRAWESSAAHRRTIRDRRFTHFGAAVGKAVVNRQTKSIVVVVYGQL